MFSKRFATEIRHASMGRQYAKPGKAEVTWVTPIDVERGSHRATERGFDVMLAIAGLHGEAAKYAAAAQQLFETELEVEDGFGVQSQADFDAERKAEAKEAFEKALERFNRAIARLSVEG